VEFFTAVFAVAIMILLNERGVVLSHWEKIGFFMAMLFFIPMALIDFKHGIIPNGLVLFTMFLGFGISFFPGGLSPLQSLAGMLSGAGILLALGLLTKILFRKKEMGLGMGDIKLLAALGLFGGPIHPILTMFLGAFSCMFYAIFLLFRGQNLEGLKIPFGPFLALGFLIEFYFRERILSFMTLFYL